MSHLIVGVYSTDGDRDIDISAACVEIDEILIHQIHTLSDIVERAKNSVLYNDDNLVESLEKDAKAERIRGLAISAYSYLDKIGDYFDDNFGTYLIIEDDAKFKESEDFRADFIKMHTDGTEVWWSGYEHHSGAGFETNSIPISEIENVFKGI